MVRLALATLAVAAAGAPTTANSRTREQQEQSRSEQMGVSRVPELERDDGPNLRVLVDRDADIVGLMSVMN
jgi:hypothetical protein